MIIMTSKKKNQLTGKGEGTTFQKGRNSESRGRVESTGQNGRRGGLGSGQWLGDQVEGQQSQPRTDLDRQAEEHGNGEPLRALEGGSGTIWSM